MTDFIQMSMIVFDQLFYLHLFMIEILFFGALVCYLKLADWTIVAAFVDWRLIVVYSGDILHFADYSAVGYP